VAVATFRRLVPIVYVTDLQAEVEFYEKLGFAVLYRGDEFPDFVAMHQGEVQFGIEQRDGFLADDANRSIMWQFQVDDLTAIVDLCRRHQLRFTVPELYWERMDAWEMKVWSPNGYRINLEGHQPRRP
jgi:catechol 2,3-dioxygenase-like lactoylglutathione lyase family enzyme